MKASFNWIKELVNVKATPQEIAQRLTLAGLEVEGISSLGVGLEKVVTATILQFQKHPEADRLSLCEVRAGNKKVSLVCGAKNFKAGDRVALALPGVTLPNGMTIQETVIRNAKSSGMLCSKSELGLADASEGILILSPETPEGIPLTEALPIQDTIFEVNVTPNRGDCLSMNGLGREVAAAFGVSMKKAAAQNYKKVTPSTINIKVKDEATDLCPRYTCRVLQGIKVGPSPQYIQSRLEACGIRAINNIVDATNYVMLETGQPLHAFDLSQIRQGKVVIRRAKAGEVLKTLDGKDQSLEKNDLVIADGERILALAGVMGGQDSGVEATTTDLLLESAYFSPTAVRKTSKRLAMQTESSYRFERGVDPNGCADALNRLTALILELAGGNSVSKMIDVYPKAKTPDKVLLRSSELKRILGVEIPANKFIAPLKALGIEGKAQAKGKFQFKIPTYRSDLTREIDLIEEVARLYGYNNIPIHYPRLSLNEVPSPKQDPLELLQQTLSAWGFNEVVHYSFTSEQLLNKFGEGQSKPLTLINPISDEMSVMRPALLPQMVQTLQKNIFNGNKNLKLFETRPVYQFQAHSAHPIQESWHLCLAMSGARRNLHFLEKEEMASYLDLKGYLTTLVNQYWGGTLVEKPSARPFLHPKRQALLEWQPSSSETGSAKGRPLGCIGELHPQLLQEMGIGVPVTLAEINLELFLTECENLVQFQKVSTFPSIWRDLNLVVDEDLPHGQVVGQIKAHGGPWVQRIELFDLYRGEPVPDGKKALTYTIEYSNTERTLTDEEVNQARESLLAKLKDNIGARLR